MLCRSLILFSIIALCSAARLLVVYDAQLHNVEQLSSLQPHISGLINQLSADFSIEYKTYQDEALSLFVSKERVYDHLILLPSSKKAITNKKDFNQYTLLDFVNDEGNVVVVGNKAAPIPDDVRGFLNEIGIYPSPKNYKLIDHFNTESGKVVLTNDNIVNSRVYGNFSDNKFLYDGSAALLSNNELLFPLITAPKTSYCGAEDEAVTQDKTWTFGQQGFLAAGFQALNNARVAWVGDDELINPELISWALQKKHVLKLQFVQHYKQETPDVINETLYRIKDLVVYTAGISELVNGKWVPFEPASEEDTVQLSFKMLDPYQRLNLKSLGPVASTEDGPLDANLFYVAFAVPDQHGMFTFELDYKRPGLSYIVDKKIVTVRHLANDEYKRSWDITNSWLYVASAVLVVSAWFLFVVNFIYVGNTDVVKKNE